MIGEELKNFRAPESDAFQRMPPDMAIFLLIVGGFCGYVLRSLFA